MLATSSLFINWKRRRWKTLRFLSTFHHYPQKSLSDIVSRNISITNYAQAGQLEQARKLFDEMSQRTVVSWNTMITGYVKWNKSKEALDLVSDMHHHGMKLNETTFSTTLSACSRIKSLDQGKQIHCLVLKSGSEDFELVGSSLVNFYASCFKGGDAWRIFDTLHGRNVLLWSLMLVGYVRCNLMKDALDFFMKMPSRDVVSWTALISGYSKSEAETEKALELFRLMRASDEVKPNEFTLDSVMRVCGNLEALNQGKVIHGLTIKCGFEFDYSICGGLVEFYCKCHKVEDAKRVYDGLNNPCLSTSNALLDGFTSIGRIEVAEMLFNAMDGLSPVSYNLMIKGYGDSGRIKDSERLFEQMPQKTIVSSNTMISVYCRNGELTKALNLFEGTKAEKNTVTWNSMISGYIQNNKAEDALKLYLLMHRLAVEHNRSTFSTLFHACSCLGALQQGKLLHAHVIKTPFESNVYVGTSLIDMYSKCGNIIDAQTAFSAINAPNVATWTALINGYAHHGLGSEAALVFEQMSMQGVSPNVVTFVGILLACSRAGLVNEGMRYFHSMKKNYGLKPSLEHYACVVDLLGRSGYLQEAEEFVHRMPIEADSVIWGTLLSACWFFMDMEVGQRVAERMLALDPKQISTYVIMSNIYAGVGRWEKVVEVRKRLRSMDVKKDPGCSWIEVKNTVHVFTVEDRSHPHCKEIYTILEELTANVYCSFHLEDTPYQYQNYDFFSFSPFSLVT